MIQPIDGSTSDRLLWKLPGRWVTDLAHPEDHDAAIKSPVGFRGIGGIRGFRFPVTDRHESLRVDSVVDKVAGYSLGAFLGKEEVFPVVAFG